VMVTVLPIDDEHVIGVSEEFVCLYHSEGSSPEEQFFAAEDPWLVHGFNDKS
jgi:hypothetical protein